MTSQIRPETHVVLTFDELERRLAAGPLAAMREQFTYWRPVSYIGLVDIGMRYSVFRELARLVGNSLQFSYCHLIERDDWQHESLRRAGGWCQVDGTWVCNGMVNDSMVFSQEGICGETADVWDHGGHGGYGVKAGYCGATVFSNGSKYVACPYCNQEVYLT